MAENSVNTMHNILTLRGAQVRDALKWAGFLNETIELYGKNVEVKFQSHHWPVWGSAKVVDYWKKHRDMYKYLHDQSVNLMNKGYVGSEIAELIKFPSELDQFWPNRGYYGTLKHNSRAIYSATWPGRRNPETRQPSAGVRGEEYFEYMARGRG